ncbi:hypothetical protein HFO88_28275 [Rhizobium leguminosarum]|uniref:hypothetical protein n=1 Tax=Rhizobium leguminosarum TaxID=384 RepID=UPI0014425374|nr:hypothetical protein [Rhizobium leguminosarum]MBY5904205.1 hypothetical protein [Rhizobium leguminosarum]MBY5911574.1 hypothetical protein [Rhizobium leguminosarum]NKK89194.1 hypothetical protein [Rhizobium leguminosarum bv. viciae]
MYWVLQSQLLQSQDGAIHHFELLGTVQAKRRYFVDFSDDVDTMMAMKDDTHVLAVLWESAWGPCRR